MFLIHKAPQKFSVQLLGCSTIRGAIPYLNNAAEPFIRELKNEEQDAQSKHAEQGKGGGIEKSLDMAIENGYVVVSGKFLMTKDDHREFAELCAYWDGKSFMDLGNAAWERSFPYADYITDGWEIGLFTAPHEPCPEGRLILDFEFALKTGYQGIIERIREKMNAHSEDTDGQQFWQAAIESIMGELLLCKITLPKPKNKEKPAPIRSASKSCWSRQKYVAT